MSVDEQAGAAVGAPIRPHASLVRPRRWVMGMRWYDLAFLHWPVAPETLRPLIPSGLTLDTFGGSAWIGIVPFQMSRVRLRGLPPVPGLSAFPELNVRTYVVRGDVRGVWFFSLDAASPIAVRGARRLYHLPYFDARMTVTSQADGLFYDSVRTHRGAPAARLKVTYAPAGPTAATEVGSLERWLTDRLALYAAAGGRIFRADVRHEPWRLAPARAEIRENTMAEPLGVSVRGAPLAHVAEPLDVVAWWRQRV